MSWTVRSVQNGSAVCHYGVLGMKWGVRRTLEQLECARKVIDTIMTAVDKKTGRVYDYDITSDLTAFKNTKVITI